LGSGVTSATFAFCHWFWKPHASTSLGTLVEIPNGQI
jgi:hypothetical protein